MAAICHGSQVLITAEVVSGRKMTSTKTIKVDLINAGADWYEQEVVVDQGLFSSGSPEDHAHARTVWLFIFFSSNDLKLKP